MKSVIQQALLQSMSRLLTSQEIVRKPENKEKLKQAEALVRSVYLSECPDESKVTPVKMVRTPMARSCPCFSHLTAFTQWGS